MTGMVIATAVCPMIEPPAVPRTATAVVSPIQLKQLTMESSGVSAGKRVRSLRLQDAMLMTSPLRVRVA